VGWRALAELYGGIPEQIDVDVFDRGRPVLPGDFVDRPQPVRRGLVGAEAQKFWLSGLSFIASRRNFFRLRGASVLATPARGS
jgi:hypothetical protein